MHLLILFFFIPAAVSGQLNSSLINPRIIQSGDQLKICNQGSGTPNLVKQDTVIKGIGQGSSLSFTSSTGYKHTHANSRWSQVSLFEKGLLCMQLIGSEVTDPTNAYYFRPKNYFIWQSERSLYENTSPLEWYFIPPPELQPDTLFYYDWILIDGSGYAMCML
ncbi:MAG: hypothetical protein AAF741_11310 [Bacteroidota bacterium]